MGACAATPAATPPPPVTTRDPMEVDDCHGWNCAVQDQICLPGTPGSTAIIGNRCCYGKWERGMGACAATPAPTAAITQASGVNSTIPCNTAVWTQAGIDELSSEGSLQGFGFPAAGTILTDSKRDRIKNMDGAINEGYVACFGAGSEWGEEMGKKCTGQHLLSASGKTLIDCQDEADAGMFPFFQWQSRTGKCKVLASCDSPIADLGWNYYSKQWTPWQCKKFGQKCSGKFRGWFAVHSQYQCQLKAEMSGTGKYYTYKSGVIKKCRVDKRCKFLPERQAYTIFGKDAC